MSVLHFIIDLDKPISDRYQEVTNSFAPQFDELINVIENIYHHMISYPLDLAVRSLTWMYHSSILFRSELEFYSKTIGIDFHKILLMQLFYEINAACTSSLIMIGDEKSLFRTMDWDLPFLKKITYSVDYHKNGKYLYSAVTWFGCVGQFTVSNSEMAMSINYRRCRSDTLTSNIYRCLNLYMPASYSLRFVMENQMSYAKAVAYLAITKMIAPTYINIVQFEKNLLEGCVISINSKGYDIFEGKFVQTNHDYKNDNQDNVIWSFERKKLCQKIIDENKFNSKSDAFQKLLINPILNEETVYCCILNKDGLDVILT